MTTARPPLDERAAAVQRAMIETLSEAVLAIQAAIAQRDAELTARTQGRTRVVFAPHEDHRAVLVEVLTDLTKALLGAPSERLGAVLKGLRAGRISDYSNAATIPETHRNAYAHGASIGFAVARLKAAL